MAGFPFVLGFSWRKGDEQGAACDHLNGKESRREVANAGTPHNRSSGALCAKACSVTSPWFWVQVGFPLMAVLISLEPDAAFDVQIQKTVDEV